MLLASFHYKDKEYQYRIVDDNIVYGYVKDDQFLTDLNSEEIELMNLIYSRFMISKNKENHKKCGILFYNKKRFQVFYDKISKRKFCYEIQGNSLVKPTFEDFCSLEELLNPTISYVNFNGKEIKSKAKEIMLYGILLTLQISLGSFIGYYVGYHNAYYEEKIRKDIAALNEEDISILDMEKYIDENENLNDEEKQVLKNHLFILEDNEDYINKQVICNRLCSVDIFYEDLNDIFNSVILTMAKYNMPKNEITVFCGQEGMDLNDTSGYYEYLSHEINHIYEEEKASLGKGLREALNEIFTQEYLEISSDSAYKYQRRAVYPLIELLGPEAMRKCHFKGNCDNIIKELMNIIPDEDKAILLLGLFDNFEQNYVEQIKNGIDEKIVLDNLFQPINELINEYYTKKYGCDMMENVIMRNYIYYQQITEQTATITQDNLEIIELYKNYPGVYQYLKTEIQNSDYLIISNDIFLPYFNSKYIESKLHNETTLDQTIRVMSNDRTVFLAIGSKEVLEETKKR